MSGATGINVSVSTLYSSQKKQQYIFAVVNITDPARAKEIANRIAQTILTVMEFRKKDFIGITTVYGFNIGIWPQYRRTQYSQTPREWLESK